MPGENNQAAGDVSNMIDPSFAELFDGGDEQDSAAADNAQEGNPADEEEVDGDEPETDAEESDADDKSEEGDDADADDGDSTEDPVLFTLENEDGTKHEVKASEAKAGYMRQQDYTRKTQDLSRERQEFKQQSSTYESQLLQEMNALQELLNGPEVDFTQEELDEIFKSDPAQYAKIRHELDNRAKVKEQVEARKQELQAKKQQEFKEYLESELDALKTAMPDIVTPEGAARMTDYAVQTYGYTPEEVQEVADHRHLMILEKARRYDELMAKQASVKPKLEKAPKLLTNKQAVTQADLKGEKVRKAKQRVAQTNGSTEAVAEMLMATGFV